MPLTGEYSIPMPHLTDNPSPPVTENTRTSRNKPTNKEFEKSSTAPSPPSSCLLQEVSETLPQFATRGLPHCYPPNRTSPTAVLLPGSDVALSFSLLHSSIQCMRDARSPVAVLPTNPFYQLPWYLLKPKFLAPCKQIFSLVIFLFPYTDVFSRSCHW